MKEQLQQTMTVKYSNVYRLDTIESLVKYRGVERAYDIEMALGIFPNSDSKHKY